jgi:hypothetical protein
MSGDYEVNDWREEPCVSCGADEGEPCAEAHTGCNCPTCEHLYAEPVLSRPTPEEEARDE